MSSFDLTQQGWRMISAFLVLNTITNQAQSVVVIAQPVIPVEENYDHLCPSGFVYVEPSHSNVPGEKGDPKCYKFFSEKTTFQNAIDKCDEIGATLATPKERLTITGLAKYVTDNGLSQRAWIGLSDREVEGTLTWIDDQQPLVDGSFAPWMVQEPDSGGARSGDRADRQDCVKITFMLVGTRSIANWYDTVCAGREAYICEVEPEEVQVTHPQIQDVVLQTTEEPSVTTGTPEIPVETWEVTNSSQVLNETDLPLTVVAYGPGVNNSTEDNSTQEAESVEQTSSGDMETPTYNRPTCHLECTPYIMKAACPLQYFPQMLEATIVLNNASCQPRRNSTHLIVHVTLDGCGTVARNIRGDEMSFSNTVRLLSRGSILRSQQEITESLEYMVLDCRYPQRHMLMQNFRPVESRPRIRVTVQNGPNLPHVFLIYKNSTYGCPYPSSDYPIRISINQRLYFEIRLRMTSNQVELHPVTCIATPNEDPYNANNYRMMEEGCIFDETFRLEPSDSGKISRFSVQAFRFLGFNTKIYVHCELIVCTVGSESSARCPYNCEDASRRRRNVGSANETQRIHISAGPIMLVHDVEEGTPSVSDIVREFPEEGAMELPSPSTTVFEHETTNSPIQVEDPDEISLEGDGVVSEENERETPGANEEENVREREERPAISENSNRSTEQGNLAEPQIVQQPSPAKQSGNVNTAGHGGGRGGADANKISFILVAMTTLIMPLVVGF
uniref:uncharacterized protein LOC100185368 isoform X2 n=1 Tax=Ciona intestinalis TaxID=7719 RepID=UPI000180C70E|nr:uncharacterized protein LOC100185368 isoform X2 [Ciona intestinalis]|eukprot:XP_002128267.3 uncharacterized protein LOC100185368 isoform X2 [Ciona intestinalis]